jgi:hypothetical protein
MLRAGLLALVAATLLFAQGFEVAAIRRNRDPAADPNVNSLPGGRLIVTDHVQNPSAN